MTTHANSQALAELIDIVEALSSDIEAGSSAPAALQRLPTHLNAAIRAHLCGGPPPAVAAAPAGLVQRVREARQLRRLNNELACILVAVDACSTRRCSPATALRWLAASWRLRRGRP